MDRKFLENVKKADAERAKRAAERAKQGIPNVDWDQKSVDALNEAVTEDQKEKDKGVEKKGE